MTIKLYRAYDLKEIEFQQWLFPMKEVGVKITNPEQIQHGSTYTIVADFPDSDEIFIILNLVNALNNLGIRSTYITIDLPYLPYSRQDRVCSQGEAFSLEVILKVLSTTGCFIRTEDLHSQVAFTKLHTPFLHSTSQAVVANNLPKFDYLIAPDKGSHQKASEHVQVCEGDTKLITLNKHRIGSSIVYEDLTYDTVSGTVCVVDDLCDGGGTFMSLGMMLKRTQPRIESLSLYVTHGGFTKGLADLRTIYKTVYVKNLMKTYLNQDDCIVVL